MHGFFVDVVEFVRKSLFADEHFFADVFCLRGQTVCRAYAEWADPAEGSMQDCFHRNARLRKVQIFIVRPR